MELQVSGVDGLSALSVAPVQVKHLSILLLLCTLAVLGRLLRFRTRQPRGGVIDDETHRRLLDESLKEYDEIWRALALGPVTVSTTNDKYHTTTVTYAEVPGLAKSDQTISYPYYRGPND